MSMAKGNVTRGVVLSDVEVYTNCCSSAHRMRFPQIFQWVPIHQRARREVLRCLARGVPFPGDDSNQMQFAAWEVLAIVTILRRDQCSADSRHKQDLRIRSGDPKWLHFEREACWLICCFACAVHKLRRSEMGRKTLEQYAAEHKMQSFVDVVAGTTANTIPVFENWHALPRFYAGVDKVTQWTHSQELLTLLDA